MSAQTKKENNGNEGNASYSLKWSLDTIWQCLSETVKLLLSIPCRANTTVGLIFCKYFQTKVWKDNSFICVEDNYY